PFYRDHHTDGWVRVCPSGAVAVDGGMAWFAESARGGADPESLAGAVDVMCSLIDATIADTRGGLDAVVLGGFSQGAAMALAVAAELGRRGPGTLGGLLIQAGFLPEAAGEEFPVADIAAKAVLVQHPADDEVVPVFMGRDLAELLAGAPGVGDVEIDIV